MSVSQIKELMTIIANSNFQFANIQSDQFHLVVSKRHMPDYPMTNNDVVEMSSSIIQQNDVRNDKPISESIQIKDVVDMVESVDTLDIVSPLVGIAYLSPSPDEPPFVKKGDVIKKGQVVCIVEAMKIMNEIKSEYDGVVVDIMVENEGVVEFSQPLVRIKEEK